MAVAPRSDLLAYALPRPRARVNAAQERRRAKSREKRPARVPRWTSGYGNRLHVRGRRDARERATTASSYVRRGDRRIDVRTFLAPVSVSARVTGTPSGSYATSGWVALGRVRTIRKTNRPDGIRSRRRHVDRPAERWTDDEPVRRQ